MHYISKSCSHFYLAGSMCFTFAYRELYIIIIIIIITEGGISVIDDDYDGYLYFKVHYYHLIAQLLILDVSDLDFVARRVENWRQENMYRPFPLRKNARFIFSSRKGDWVEHLNAAALQERLAHTYFQHWVRTPKWVW
jgi:hypothetical protein